MSFDYDRLQELADTANPGPWELLDEYADGEPRPDTSRMLRGAGGEYLGIMHTPDAQLAALAPELARELLRLRDEIQATRDRVADELERTPVEIKAARITMYAERRHFLAFCNDLLEGGH